MGFFSWNCKSCGHPMLCRGATEDKNEWMTKVVAMFKDGNWYVGTYDGYGGVGVCGVNLADGHGEPCCYHEACWVKAGRPEYDGPSDHAADQGWFFEDGVHNIPEP